jgi:hypothetical protein
MSEKTVKVVTLITSVIIIWIVTKIVAFVERMPQCACSVPTETLDRIEFLEKVIIAFIGFSILYQLYTFNGPMIANAGLVSSPIYLGIAVISFLVYMMFAYNVNDFRKSISGDCKCADTWEKTAMYAQAIYYALMISFIVITTLFLLSMGALSFKSGPGRNMIIILFSIIAVGAWSIFGGDLNVFLDKAIDAVETEGFECGCNLQDGKKHK